MQADTALTDLWKRACEILRASLGEDQYARWFGDIVPESFDGKTFTLELDNDFQKMWFNEHYIDPIRDALMKLGAPSDLLLAFNVRGHQNSVAEPRAAVLPPPVTHATPVQPAPDAPKRPVRLTSFSLEQLNAEFTFENFVTGPSNGWAYNAACEVARKPGKAYNPLFIYGPTGVGKTHLMQAIGHGTLAKHPSLKIRYVTCEAMLNDYVDCVAHKQDFVNFRKRYRSVDVLMVDDIQFLTGKESLQDEFFNTYNELYTRGKQIVMTSDLPPKEIAGLPDRLVSRFSEGLVTQIESPKFETRLAILRYKQTLNSVQFSDEVLSFIADRITSNVRALEGALTRVTSYLSMNRHIKLSIDDLKMLLKDLLDSEQRRDPTCSEIQKAVADYFRLTMRDMTSEDRQRSISEPRQLAMFLCRKLTKHSLPDIGKAFEKKHATVFHSCNKMKHNLKLDHKLYDSTVEILRSLGCEVSALQLEDADD